MIIDTHLERKILRNYFFIVGTIKDINVKYFINKINKEVLKDNAKSFTTNVQGKMTYWDSFVNDPEFQKLFFKFRDYVDSNNIFGDRYYKLKDCWGYVLNKKGYTKFHDHLPNVWSGAIYLNDHSQVLHFPEIGASVKPKKGRFVLFSSFLKHGCRTNETNKLKYGLSFNCEDYNSVDQVREIEGLNNK